MRERALGADIDGKRHRVASRGTAPVLPSAREARRILEQFAAPAAETRQFRYTSDPLRHHGACAEPCIHAGHLRSHRRRSAGADAAGVVDCACQPDRYRRRRIVLGLFSEVSPTGPAGAR